MFGERLVSHLPILMNQDDFESQIFHIFFLSDLFNDVIT